MILAVTSMESSPDIFQHFGKAPQFYTFEIEKGSIVKTFIIDATAAGHSATIDLLKENHVNTVICGGIGAGAKEGLSKAGIELISGIKGTITLAVNTFLAGELTDQGGSCSSHHGEHEHDHNCNHQH